MQTPVVFLIFNRPDLTAKVFEVIRQAKPRKLLVVADGPRTDRPNEVERCKDTRKIISQVNWECEVLTNYSEINLGCKKRVSSGLDWVFDNVEQAIILEDDCLPHSTFFPFCEELLRLYQNDMRVMNICGSSFINETTASNSSLESYYFSRDFHCWGWASWKRAWQYYDCEMDLWPHIRDTGRLKDVFHNIDIAKYWEYVLQSAFEDRVDSWAYRWMFSCWMQSGLSILPYTNLISNIGYGNEATHTSRKDKLSNQAVSAVNLPIRHPPFVIEDTRKDKHIGSFRFRANSVNLWKIKIKQLLKLSTGQKR